MPDLNLIKGCIREDKSSQKALFVKYAGKMMVVCLRYARRPEEAKDILQEGFIKVFDNIGQFRHAGSFEGWVRRIMINTALKYYRKSSFRLEKSGIESYQENAVEPEIYSQLSEKEILKLVGELPDGYKMVFNLYVIEGYSHKEIADLLEISDGTSRSQLAEGRKILQKKIMELEKSIV